LGNGAFRLRFHDDLPFANLPSALSPSEAFENDFGADNKLDSRNREADADARSSRVPVAYASGNHLPRKEFIGFD
jgi:hypothetical protein